jgi:putative Mg2+ transporter-C (MgtC) family protein
MYNPDVSVVPGGKDMPFYPEDIVKILLAILAGGLIGLEREFRDKAAGFRTLIFICVGAALFTIFSVRLGDSGRIAAALVTGVGFLGAGAILRSGGRIIGLTTAATIWLIAALGMGFGLGEYTLTSVMTIIGLIVLWMFPALERQVDKLREERDLELILPYRPEKVKVLEDLFAENHLRIISRVHHKTGMKLTILWKITGEPARHETVMETLMNDPEIESIRY